MRFVGFRIGLLFVLLSFSGCAAHYTPEALSDPYGFFSGIWHGLVFPFAVAANFVAWVFGLFGISFLDSIEIVGRPNTGFFYYFGFCVGLASSLGGVKQ